MPVLFDLVHDRLTGEALSRMGAIIGADADRTASSARAALPLIIGALAGRANTAQRDAKALLKMLDKQYGGRSLEEPVASFNRSVEGAAVLEYLYGDKQPAVEEGLSRACGMEIEPVMALLPQVADLLMTALAALARDENLDADGVARLLNRERSGIERSTPGVPRGGLLDYLEAEGNDAVRKEAERIGARFCAAPPLPLIA